MKKIFILLIPVTLALGCNKKTDFEITDFNAFANFEFKGDTLNLPVDLTNAVIQGITIPTGSQCNGGYFKINFRVINRGKNPREFYYKIFYQNESYKYVEFNIVKNKQRYNELSAGNFYGSWENPSDGFHKTSAIPSDKHIYLISDSFRIIGNPRNEKKYFGAPVQTPEMSEDQIEKVVQSIIESPEWYQSIKEKAAKNNLAVEEQLYRDAIWTIKTNTQKGDDNNRWKRNPRVGFYSFVLLVGTSKTIKKIPEAIKDISKVKDDIFINPYYVLLNNTRFLNRFKDKLIVLKSDKMLKTYVVMNLLSGIYVDKIKFNRKNINESYFSNNCGNSEKLFSDAQFEQYFQNSNQNLRLNNIPVTFDVTNKNYSQEDYFKNRNKFGKDELIQDFIKNTDCPCQTVNVDTSAKFLTITNPGNKGGQLRKENVGVNSRIGFTYGRYIARIKFPAIINQSNVWNGITGAFWLKFQDENEWNNRSVCDNEGYIPENETGETPVRVNTTFYSEIDIDILKTSEFWPKTSYKNSKNYHEDNPASNRDIIINCTNWDMACRSPENFCIGATDFIHDSCSYVVHRWDDWYKALTIKHSVNHDSIFCQPYYFEIDWEPESVTWKIGKTKEDMRIIGYMDNTITTIPDNQMVMVFSQEFQDASWWPLAPFKQDFIPFPENDIVGKILEVQVE